MKRKKKRRREIGERERERERERDREREAARERRERERERERDGVTGASQVGEEKQQVVQEESTKGERGLCEYWGQTTLR